MAPIANETENNVYAKFWGDKQRVLWYVMTQDFFLRIQLIRINNENSRVLVFDID